MYKQYHKMYLFEKEKTFSSNLTNNPLFFSMKDSFKNTPRPN